MGQVPAPPDPGSTGSGTQIGGTGQIPSPPDPGSGSGSQQIGGSGQVPTPPNPGGGSGSTQIGGAGSQLPEPPNPGGGGGAQMIGGNDSVPEPPNPGGGSGFPMGTIQQSLTIPAGWSGVSSQVIPHIPELDSLLAAETESGNLVIMQHFSQVFWPQFNINTIGSWNTHQGYTIKVLEETTVDIYGFADENDTINFIEGWNSLPVISGCSQNTEAFFSDLVANDQLIIVYEIADNGVYWPEMSINTMPVLERGKAYMVKVTEDCQASFPECDGQDNLIIDNEAETPGLPWQVVNGTPLQQFLLIPGAYSSVISSDDYVGAFTEDGICAGATEITDPENNHALVIYGDDPTTPEKDGFDVDEEIKLVLYRPSTGQYTELYFSVNGQRDFGFDVKNLNEIQNLQMNTSK